MEMIIIGIVMAAAIGFLIWAIIHPIKKVSEAPSDKLSTINNKAEGKRVNKRYLLWAALLIAAVTAVRPMYWLGIIGFAGFMVVLAVFVGLVVTYLLSLKKGSLYREMGFGVLIIVTVCAVIILKFSAPELSAGEVKANLKAASAEYKGDGIWKVKFVRKAGGAFYLYYDENTEECYKGIQNAQQ